VFRTDGKPSPDFYIRNIATSLRYINDKELSEFGITNQQARLLGAIRRSLYDGVNISRKFLEDLMGLRGPSVTSLLNGLEKKGFIIRYTAQDDGRAMQIKVTEKGERIMTGVNQFLIATEKRLLSGMTEDEKVLFVNLLHKAFLNISPNHAHAKPPHGIDDG